MKKHFDHFRSLACHFFITSHILRSHFVGFGNSLEQKLRLICECLQFGKWKGDVTTTEPRHSGPRTSAYLDSELINEEENHHETSSKKATLISCAAASLNGCVHTMQILLHLHKNLIETSDRTRNFRIGAALSNSGPSTSSNTSFLAALAVPLEEIPRWYRADSRLQ
jgi:hypothetical protein